MMTDINKPFLYLNICHSRLIFLFYKTAKFIIIKIGKDIKCFSNCS